MLKSLIVIVLMKIFFYPTVAAFGLHRHDEGLFFIRLSLRLVFIGLMKTFFYLTVAAVGLHRLDEDLFLFN
ncbi:hypothetical protein [Mesobacillus foraminis]|uniref:hypothetical protein n=1 Tax=Mesobacillus foraminis TaxID=279826 RepID=UPI0010435944|nr:hypothetical protein [Mesobacillus foraminis]